MPYRLLLVAAAGSFLFAAAAAAQSRLSVDDVIRIAYENGMAEIDEVERDDDGWEVEGRDTAGNELELEINAAGVVTERDD
jgi:hypothetical protein